MGKKETKETHDCHKIGKKFYRKYSSFFHPSNHNIPNQLFYVLPIKATAGRVRLKQSVEIYLLSKSLATPKMAFNHLKSFVMPLLLVTNLLILLSNNAFPVEARHLLETTFPEAPDLSSFPLPELPAGLPNKFEFFAVTIHPKGWAAGVCNVSELLKSSFWSVCDVIWPTWLKGNYTTIY